MNLVIVWRWDKRNGMPYEEEFNEYQQEVKKRFASGLATKDINLAYAYNDEPEISGVIVNAATSGK